MSLSRPVPAARWSRRAITLATCALLATPAATPAAAPTSRDDAIQRLETAVGGAARVSRNKATGAARFVRVAPGGRALGNGVARTPEDKARRSEQVFREHGRALGLDDPSSLRLTRTDTDAIGETHLTYRQFHGAVPVFAGILKTHFDAAGRLKAVTGTVIPDVTVDAHPIWSDADAAPVALALVVGDRGANASLGVGSAKLYVYREGLAKGEPGENHLAWEIEVTNGAGIRELVYVDAHTGKPIDRVSGIHDELFRRAYDGHNLPNIPVNYPNGEYWSEGEKFPTVSTEANNMIVASEETYDLFFDAFGRDSIDGDGAIMDAIFNRGYDCPNASWNGTFISFCPGLTVDDVTAHEWGHAYTQYTHGLIYQWQPGALNESYSDIWGETVDQINGRGGDTPFTARTAACSTFSPPVGTLRVNSPAAIAGDKFAQSAAFGPPLSATGLTGNVVVALDEANAAGPTTFDGCSAITNGAAVAGNVAIVDRGTCEFSTKVLNAQNAGAVAVIIANNVAGGLPGMGAGAVAAQVTIPSLGIQQSDGNAIRAQLAASTPVNGTLLARPGTDASVRWLLGEDSAAVGLVGALRDMWNPTCYANPGKVTDTVYYTCGAADQGGVHTNSGVPNHAYALLVDGGTYNGRDVSAIGLTKAAHIYFRAQSVYQVFDSDFADHADALEASCADLTGQPLNALGGGPSAEVITAADCAEVADAIAAVELRTPPACVFPTLLDPRTAPLCSASQTTGVATEIASFGFEGTGAPADWSVARETASATFDLDDWTWTTSLPSGRAGAGFFVEDPNSSCNPGAPNESGVRHLTSPAIGLPAGSGFARATFEHWVATEAGFDGGVLSVSVNGGPWQVVPPSQFTFNNYSVFLFTAAQGNTDPLAGLPAWSGTDQGTVSGGSWGRTHVNLGNFARPGDTVRLRWTFGTDLCGGRTGWYLDNVSVFGCVPNVPAVSVVDAAFPEGNAGRTARAIQVRLSQPTIVPVVVQYEVVDGTAHDGNDFEKAGVGTLVIPASTAIANVAGGTITVTIKGDVAPEGDEALTVRVLGVTNATVADGEGTVTIVNDD
jgi:Zn-dependent metalloprotease